MMLRVLRCLDVLHLMHHTSQNNGVDIKIKATSKFSLIEQNRSDRFCKMCLNLRSFSFFFYQGLKVGHFWFSHLVEYLELALFFMSSISLSSFSFFLPNNQPWWTLMMRTAWSSLLFRFFKSSEDIWSLTSILLLFLWGLRDYTLPFLFCSPEGSMVACSFSIPVSGQNLMVTHFHSVFVSNGSHVIAHSHSVFVSNEDPM